MPTKLQALGGRRRKFKRPATGSNTSDDAGTVQVSVILLDAKKGQHRRGNITRSFRLANCRVSEVAHIIAERLFTTGSGPSSTVPHITL